MAKNDKSKSTIDAARRSFNRELLSADFPRIHGNDEQLQRLLEFLDPKTAGAYLDLATGNGYVAFAVAGHRADAHVVGIDIAEQAISSNQAAAKDISAARVEFRVSDGLKIDFPDAYFDGVTCRYALHHFPEIESILGEVRRVLAPAGVFVVSDAIRNPGDHRDFINRFQGLKPDGHVRMYSAAELVEVFRTHGFETDGQFGSTISFTRDLTPEYRDLLEKTPPEILDLYEVKISGDQAALKFDVLNARFVASIP